MTSAYARPRRLRVEHRTEFRYARPAAASYNECRITPRTEARQQILETAVTISPSGWRYEYVDYWGTAVTAFEARTPHDLLVVNGVTVADIGEPGEPPRADWNRLRSPATLDAFAETLTPTARSAPPPELAALAREVADGREPATAAQAVSQAITDAMQYESGSTSVRTSAAEAWTSRRGVCQDFAHLTVGALRSIGVPARYVSGYVQPKGDSEVDEAVVGESHAWVEWWTGGWFGWDPTHGQPVSSRHLAVGRGRDYGDVPPLRGIVSGAGESDLTVSVTITRLR